MNETVKNYVFLTNELLADGEYLFNMNSKDVHWQRNFIRTMFSMIEGYSHCLREIVAAGFDLRAKNISENEKKILSNEKKSGATKRIKLTLKVAYRMFELEPAPDFGTQDWMDAMEGIKKRNLLMHPKTIADLEILPEYWERIYSGFSWLFERHANFIQFLFKQHGK